MEPTRITFAGDSIEIRGWLKTDNVVGFAGLWLRQDAADVERTLLTTSTTVSDVLRKWRRRIFPGLAS